MRIAHLKSSCGQCPAPCEGSSGPQIGRATRWGASLRRADGLPRHKVNDGAGGAAQSPIYLYLCSFGSRFDPFDAFFPVGELAV